MKPSHRILVGAVAALLVFYFAWEWYLSPQARVERFLHSVADAAEDKDTDTILSSFSREYSDFRGLDYERVSSLIERGFGRVDRLNVTIEGTRVEVEASEAKAAFDLTVVGVRGDERFLLVGQPLQGEKLRVELRQEEGEWKILSVARSESEY